MTAPLADAELKHLLNFISYGRLDANVWLLGMEEAGGGEANIRTCLKSRPVMDDQLSTPPGQYSYYYIEGGLLQR